MAHSDKNILITPNRGQSADPKIEFVAASATLGPQTITLNVYPTDNGTLSWEGSAGQLFSLTNNMTGTIYSVNDVSGIPSIEVLDSGLVKLAQYSGNVLLGTGSDNGTDKLQVSGSVLGTVLKSSVATGTAPLTVTSTTRVANLNVATAGTADQLTTARYINGTSFNGTSNITTAIWGTARTINGTSINGSTNYTTANWGTARTITIGNTSKSVNGSANVSWTLGEIGAAGTTTPTFTGLREVRVAMPANNIDLNTGNLFTKTISGATTFTVSNTVSAGNVNSFILELTNGGSATITWWSGVKWAGGTAPALTAAGRDVLGFYTHDAGTTWNGLVLAKDIK